MSSLATATLERDGDFVIAQPLSIALIGPSDPRRSAVSSVLAEYPAIRVAEFSSYPTHLDTVARLLAQEFNILIVDLDSDPKAALNLIECIRRETTVTVIPYTEEADPELMTRCMRSGAREHLVLPVRQSTLDRIFARARISLPSDAQPASKPEPQVVELPEQEVWRDDPPASEPVRIKDEDPPRVSEPAFASPLAQVTEPVSAPAPEPVSEPASEQPLGWAAEQTPGPVSGQEQSGNGAAPDPPPAPASRGQATGQGSYSVSSSSRRPGGVIVEEIRFTPEARPVAAPLEREDHLQELRAAHPESNGRLAAASPWEKFLSGASVAPAISNRPVEPAVKWRDSFEPVESTPAIAAEDETELLAFHSDLADLGDEDSDRKKWVRIGAASFAALVVLLFVGPRLFAPAKHTLAAQSAAPVPVASDSEPPAKTLKPSPSNALRQGHLSAATGTRQTSFAQPAANVEEAIWPKADSAVASATPTTALAPQGAQSAPPQVDSTMMSAQLASTPRIPQDLKAPRKAETPPPAGLNAANAEELADGAVVAGNVFSRPARAPAVLPPAPVVIPVNVAEKLLFYKTLPTYPADAYKHYISGKVVLEAIVSASGSVESLKFVSGPKVLEQAALDAVKTWRYKPYVVDGKLVRVQTTVTLTFDPHR